MFAIPAVLFAGMSKGGFGSAASFAATPFLALILEPGQAVGLMLPLLMVMDVTAIKMYWRKWDLRVAGVLIVGALPGIILGTLLYGFADPNVFKFLIGLVAVGFVIWQLGKSRKLFPQPKREMGTKSGLFWGAMVGITSFISHAGGPPAAVYMLTKRLDKMTYQATSVLVFWAVNIMKVVPYSFVGIFSKQTLTADLMLLPFAVLGVLFGVWMHHKVSEKLFFGLTYVFLAVTGTKLIWEALAA
ncbi:sulfite exporter TauE/SafE family protein [Celeribacter litoreus]|uniref:sulfite exporter TauE/SafE family protein n=1 Tax=Celeribacter litoreus TaxID=2876714 RepID=UPI001CC915B8|nr:sulfite exporter TauE/SafE family protein [Celeribacter litoreus]